MSMHQATKKKNSIGKIPIFPNIIKENTKKKQLIPMQYAITEARLHGFNDWKNPKKHHILILALIGHKKKIPASKQNLIDRMTSHNF